MSKRINFRIIGEFEVTSGSLTVSDPSYGVEVQCKGTLAPVLNGTWEGMLTEVGNEPESLMVYAKSADFESLALREKLEKFEGIIGVDTAQVGIYDTNSFPKVSEEIWDLIEGDKYEKAGWVISLPYGVVARTAHGDGMYDCIYSKNADGIIDAVYVDLLGIYDEIFKEARKASKAKSKKTAPKKSVAKKSVAKKSPSKKSKPKKTNP